MKKLLRRIPLVLIVGAVIASLVYGFKPKPVEVDLAPVQRGLLQVTIEEDGKTRIKDRFVVAAPLGGRMQRLDLKPGSPVRSPLVVIDPPQASLLDERTRQEARARVDVAQASLRRANAALDEARHQEDFARVEHARLSRLGVSAAPQELENAEMRQRTATERTRVAQFAVQVAEYEHKLAQAALQFSTNGSPGESSTWRLEVPSPIVRGKVLRVLQESATVVTPGTALVEVGDPANLEAEIDVLTTDAVKVTPGMRVLLDHWGGEKPLEGHVRLVEPSGFTKISALGVEEQRVNIIVDFATPENQGANMGDGYRVEARIIIWEGKDVLKIPTGAMFRHEGGRAVFVVSEGTVVLRPIKIGHNNGLEAEVLEGLTEGEVVILHAGDQIKAGVAVVERGRN